jgi:VIT1/CCC1 family predicted Fe2+/Mn2+ transporter
VNVRPWLAPIEPRVSDAATDAAELQARIDLVASGGARAAVLGVSDGLVTNLSLILALAGADAATTSVRLAAFASLIAGAVSMAAGEWISVRSQVELYQGALAQIRALVSRNPGLMLNEVARRLEAAGFARETAHAASTELPLDEPRFLRFSSRLVFGVDEDQVGSPWVAAGSSFALFATGALVPTLPWLVTGGAVAAWLSVACTAVVSVFGGAVVSRSSGRSAAGGALRQGAIVAFAAAATFAIGVGFGSTVG